MNNYSVYLLLIILECSVPFINCYDLLRKSTSRCVNVCNLPNRLQKDAEGDCQRGCQYFNIEFLVSATNPRKVVDINTVENYCKASCTEAYIQTIRKNACFAGCKGMKDVQKQAPFLNDWIVYMGASEKGMVLLRSDVDNSNANDWILLESFMEADDLNNYNDQYSVVEASKEQHIDEISISKTNFLIDYHLPFWMWLVPTGLLLSIFWMFCGTIANGNNVATSDAIAQEINDKYLCLVHDSLLLPPKYSDIVSVPPEYSADLEETATHNADDHLELKA